MQCYIDKFESQFGLVIAAVDEDGYLVFLTIQDDKNLDWVEKSFRKRFDSVEWNQNKCSHVMNQMREYCEGTRKDFDLKYRVDGTDFRKRVWDELTRIPYGTAITYGELARRVGNPAASRAVGNANRNNAIMVVIPCHRVVRTDGKVVGPDGNCSIREDLLIHEGAKPPFVR